MIRFLGIFFMYFQSRLLTLQARPEQAVEVLQNALMLKLEYIQVSLDYETAVRDQILITLRWHVIFQLQHICLVSISSAH